MFFLRTAHPLQPSQGTVPLTVLLLREGGVWVCFAEVCVISVFAINTCWMNYIPGLKQS